MKRIFLVAALLCSSLLSYAGNGKTAVVKTNPHHQKSTEVHEHGGKFLLGGALTLWSDSKENVSIMEFEPEFGYLFGNNWGVGIMLGFSKEQETKTLLTKEINYVQEAFSVTPFLRYFYHRQMPFSLYLDLVAGFSSSRHGFEGEKTEKSNGFEVGIRPGASIDIAEGLCLCMKFGFFGYRDQYYTREEPGITSNGFGIRFAPEELMIGLELEF